MDPGFSYHHLYYFWVVAHEGGVARGAARLGLAVQTVSAQLRALEAALGRALLRPAGRSVALTEAGEAALRQADQIFALGAALPQLVCEAATAAGPRLVVGVSDSLAKIVVHRLLAPVTATPGLRLRCEEGTFDRLLAELALHRLDLVIADRPAPANRNLRLYSHALGRSALAWYAPAAMADAVRAAQAGHGGFPAALAALPVLLPTPQSAVRTMLDRWFERHGLRPRIAGEFADSALLKTFAAGGMGLFAGPVIGEPALVARYGVQRVALCDGVEEQFFAIGTERKVQHPLVRQLVAASP